MSQRTLGILGSALLVLGVGLGAGTLAFAIASQDAVTALPPSYAPVDRPQILNPGAVSYTHLTLPTILRV